MGVISPEMKKYQKRKLSFRSLKKQERIRLILDFLASHNRWVTTQEINVQFPIAKRTLRATLASMVDQDLVRKTTSLRDTRVTLYSLFNEVSALPE
jgi:DNA-binding IclR family transcriptional regulator